VDGSIRHNCQLEGDTFWDAQPVEADERWSNVFRPSNSENWPSRTFLKRLETLDDVSRESKQDTVAVIQSGKNECNNKRLEH